MITKNAGRFTAPNVQGRRGESTDTSSQAKAEGTAIASPKPAAVAAARAAHPQRIVVAFQTHRYTRTRDLYEDFVAVLSRCDVLVLLEVSLTNMVIHFVEVASSIL